MREDVVMPQMGESVAEGTVTVWLKEIGDFVERDEPLFEITTDKVDAEVPSPVEGVLVERLVDPGMTVEINTIVARIDTNGEGGSAEASAPAASTPSQPEAPAPAASTAATQPSSPQSRPAANGAGVAMAGITPGPEHTADQLRRTRSTPLVRKIAAEHGIEDLSPIPASGRGGRVTRDDILGFIERGDHRQPAQVTPAASSAPAPARSPQPGATMREIPALPPVQMNPRDTIEPMAPQRLAIARHMVASRATSAHAHTVHEVDFGAVVAARKALKGDFAARGVKLTFTAFMVQAFGQALVEFPLMNASIDADNNIIYRGDINVGVAVALDDSLIVPVVRNVDELSLLGVARAVNDLAERARTKKLKPDEVRGGTFTVSNHGVFGPEFGIPVINQPQVGIVATGAIKKRVVVDQKTDAILVRPTSIFCMSFDHRVIDGATADKFLKRVRELLENWTV